MRALIILMLVGCNGEETGDSPDAALATLDAALQSRGCDFAEPTCTGETICIANQCESAFGRTYRLTLGTASIAQTTDEGSPWDPVGAPDPFVSVWLNGVEQASTSVRNDTFAPTWNEFIDFVVTPENVLQLDVWDEDLTEHDFIGSCIADPLSAALLRGSALACNASTYSLIATIEPL